MLNIYSETFIILLGKVTIIEIIIHKFLIFIYIVIIFISGPADPMVFIGFFCLIKKVERYNKIKH